MGARCVVWHARGTGIPGELLAALDRKGVAWKAWDSEFLAVAELSRLGIEDRAIVIAVDPARLPHRDHTLEVLERYRPGVAVWAFDMEGERKLWASSAKEIREKYGEREASNPGPAASGGSSKPALRLVGAGEADANSPTPTAAPSAEPGDGPPAAALLSDEELRALLDDEEPNRRRQRS